MGISSCKHPLPASSHTVALKDRVTEGSLWPVAGGNQWGLRPSGSQPKGTGFCQQPEWAWMQTLRQLNPEVTLALVSILSEALWVRWSSFLVCPVQFNFDPLWVITRFLVSFPCYEKDKNLLLFLSQSYFYKSKLLTIWFRNKRILILWSRYFRIN